MRKALIAVAVATALFAVGAFAAELTVNSEDIASGTDPVQACADAIDVDFGNPVLDTTTGAWTVTTAAVNFLTAAGAVDNGCNQFDAQLAIDFGTGGYQSVGDVLVGTDASAAYTFAAADVEGIVGASVVVDGATLTVDLLP